MTQHHLLSSCDDKSPSCHEIFFTKESDCPYQPFSNTSPFSTLLRLDLFPSMATISRSSTPGTDVKDAVLHKMTRYMMGGFSAAKTRRLLERIPNFKSVDGPAYSTANLEATFHTIRTADREAENGDPYMALIMKCAHPFNFRRKANADFAASFPAEASQVNEKAELEEMGMWEDRWREEIRLLRQSVFDDFRERAEHFEEDLRDYVGQLKREDRSEPTRKVCHFGDKLFEIAKSCFKAFGSPKRGRPEKKADKTVIKEIPRPSLKLITAGARLSPARKTGEGVSTPGAAQHLDPEGYFSPRPRTPSRTPPKTPI